MDQASEQTLFLPDGFGFISLSIPIGSLEGLPNHHGLFLDALMTAFNELNAVYAVSLHEITLSVERMEWEQFRTLLGGVHLFSLRLVDTVGHDRLVAAAPVHGDLEGGGIWLRFADDYEYGMPDEFAPNMERLLKEMWTKVDL